MGIRAQMRRDDHIVPVQQKRLDLTFDGMHIQRRARDQTLVKSIGQRLRINHRAARCVDQRRAAFHRAQGLSINHVLCKRRQRHMQADNIGSAQQLIKANEGDAILPGKGMIRGDIVGDDAHIERQRAPRHLFADASQADDAQCFFCQLHANLPAPDAALNPFVRGDNLAMQRQHQPERQFRY